MIPGIASLVFIPLLAVFIAHLMWAFGSSWPVADRRTLARTVVGRPGIARMPSRLLTFLLALAIFAAGIVALMLTDPNPNGGLTAIGALAGAVFVFRGILGYLPQWRALTPEQPFATLDRRVYSPLCLFIGAGFVFLVVWRIL